MPESTNKQSHVFRENGISYLRIPAIDVNRSAEFYQAVFDWKVHKGKDHTSFEDGDSNVIGHWVANLPVVGEAGIIPYVYVTSVNDTIERINENGGKIVKSPHPEGDLRVATFHDPAGNVVGIWQRGPLQI